MIYPQSEMTSSGRFRVWTGFLSNTFFSSMILLFLFWVFSISGFLDNIRDKSASSAHMLLIFGNNPSDKEISGLKITLEKIAGGGNVVSMSDLPQNSKTMAVKSRRILSVTLSLGKTSEGKIVNLSDQVASIQSIVKNDSEISDVIFNPEWVSRVDQMAHISERARLSLVFFITVLILGLALYWGKISKDIWRLSTGLIHPAPSAGSEEERSLQFQREERNHDLLEKDQQSIEELKESTFTPLACIRTATLYGAFCGLLAIFFVWTTKSVIYPEGMNPFLALGPGNFSRVPLWVLFPLLTGFSGMFGGVAYAIHSPLSSAGKD